MTQAPRTVTGDQDAARDHARLQALFQGMLDPVVTIDSRGKVLQAGDSVRDVFGYEPEELVGQNIRVLMPEPTRSEHDGYLENYRRTGATGILGRTREFGVLKKDGTSLVCELSVSRVDVPGDPEPLFVGSFRDITRRKRAEDGLAVSEQRFHAIFDQEFQLVALLDPEGVVLDVNQSALHLLHAPRETVIGRLFWKTAWWNYSAADRQRIEEGVHAAAQGEFVRFEIDVPTAKGLRSYDFSLKPIRDAEGRVTMLLPEGRDITLLKRVQLRETAMLKAMAAIGESASVLAHEIKNPLTAVNLALRAVADSLGEDQRSVVEELSGRLQKLERTMRRTLSFAKPLDLELASVDPAVLLSGVEELLHEQLEASGVRIVADVQPGVGLVVADPALLEDVLTNLVRNATEAYGEAGGEIRLCAEVRDERSLALCVEDDGPGIPEHLRRDLFQPFVTGRAEGSGLGLAIVRKIVEAHGGRIQVSDRPAGGTVFEIELPRVLCRPGGMESVEELS